ncbi:MAG TPA: tRNA pseudouridine(38-40) synthase TruA [Phycisphaerales bacterium]|nr:tRNA pseudouridine(38-40) synthase TruA [Phycisphaerales bacterium]HMP36797.1 tRNA pseudouridine(38-40) synthase TruA [Phycisphaerales bacterium]
MPRYRLTVAYDGTDFHGWQRQEPPGREPLRTVQGVLDEAIRRVLREPAEVTGASRTDAGVHATGQVAAFTAAREIPAERLAMALTSALPPDVQVNESAVVMESFDPISEATAKGYSYSIVHGSPPDFWPDLFRRRYVFRAWPRLDPRAMAEGATHLVGEHDFTSFAHAAHRRESPIRRVLRCDVIEEGPHALRIEIAGTGFLYNMVRIIAGTLVDVGRGRLRPDDVAVIRDARDRGRAGQTLPAQGLCLRWVEYGG